MEKSAEAFRTISEVSELLDTPAHVLRFWESRFSQVKPLKRAGGRRYYRPTDLALLAGIKKLLHDDGLTIRGVQKILKESGVRHVAALSAIDVSQLGESPVAAEAAEPVAPKTVATPRLSPFGGSALPQRSGTSHWPDSPSPDVAEGGDRLVADPDDLTEETFDEAPMEIDAPMLPLGGLDNVRPLQFESKGTKARPADKAPASEQMRPPAAAMLRAMNALRARDKKAELRAVYDRLSSLRARLAERSRSSHK